MVSFTRRPIPIDAIVPNLMLHCSLLRTPALMQMLLRQRLPWHPHPFWKQESKLDSDFVGNVPGTWMRFGSSKCCWWKRAEARICRFYGNSPRKPRKSPSSPETTTGGRCRANMVAAYRRSKHDTVSFDAALTAASHPTACSDYELRGLFHSSHRACGALRSCTSACYPCCRILQSCVHHVNA